MRIFEYETRVNQRVLPVERHSIEEEDAFPINKHLHVFELKHMIRGACLGVEFELVAESGTAAAQYTEAKTALDALASKRVPDLLDSFRGDVNLLWLFRDCRSAALELCDFRHAVALLSARSHFRRLRLALLRLV